MRPMLVLALVAAVCSVAAADAPQKGENEVSLRAVYSDTDLGSSDGFDLGTSESLDVSITYGWMVTDRHEFGLVAGYTDEDIDGGDVVADSESDGTRLGGFYTFNFNSGGGNVTPYLGAVVASLGGDLGDAYDLQYGVELGVKYYPFKHGGFSAGLSYGKFLADAPGLDDADDISLGVGLLLKY